MEDSAQPRFGNREGLQSSAVDARRRSEAASGRPQTLIERLAERAAYGRSAVRLYEALLAKFRMDLAMRAHSSVPGGMTEARLMHIRYEAAAYCALVCECIEILGADPGWQSSIPQNIGVEALALAQALTDPRTSLSQALQTLLSAELVGNARWETLIDMAQGVGHEEMAHRFQEALHSEDEHLRDLRQWYISLL